MEKKKRKTSMASKELKKVNTPRHKKFSTKKADDEWKHIFWVGMGVLVVIISLLEVY